MSTQHSGGLLAQRKIFVFAILVCAIVAIAAANSTWLHVSTTSVLGDQLDIAASGQDVSPGLTAAGLVAIASALFLAISGRFGKYVALVLSGAAGVLVVIAGYAVMRDPRSALTTVYAEATGADSVPAAVDTAPAAWLTIVTGGLLVLVAVVGCVYARKWYERTSKYDRATPASKRSEVGSGHSAGVGAGTSAGVASKNGRPSGEIETDERQLWDALSEGVDPSND